MKASEIAKLLADFGPTILPLIQQVVSWVESGDKTVTAADIQTLIDYGKKTSADYLKEAGVTLP